MCTDLNIPLAKSRDDKSMQELSSHWTELGTLETGLLLLLHPLSTSSPTPLHFPPRFLITSIQWKITAITLISSLPSTLYSLCPPSHCILSALPLITDQHTHL